MAVVGSRWWPAAATGWWKSTQPKRRAEQGTLYFAVLGFHAARRQLGLRLQPGADAGERSGGDGRKNKRNGKQGRNSGLGLTLISSDSSTESDRQSLNRERGRSGKKAERF